jgi:hypothetical protein
LDLLVSKQWAIKLATEAARTVLSVDQIIVARQAGGPKPPGPNPVRYLSPYKAWTYNTYHRLVANVQSPRGEELGRGLSVSAKRRITGVRRHLANHAVSCAKSRGTLDQEFQGGSGH